MASWVRGKCVGKGAFGTVSVAVAKSDCRVFAVKSVDRETGLPGQLEALENEIRILRGLSSPYVVAFLGDDVTCEGAAATPLRNLHLEYLPGGSVADLDADVDERVVRHYARCLVNALRHVHSRGVVHCDVKGRNVLVGGNGSVAKLADFGAAVELSRHEHPAGILPRGSPLWMAPEVIRRESQGSESDVWSLGCTVIEMVTGKAAWEDRGVDTLTRIGYSRELPEFPSQLSELGRDFVEKCLRREPKRRWSCDQLLQHPFLLAASPNKLVESSPRCVIDWVDSDFGESDYEDEEKEEEMRLDSENSAKERIGKLATRLRANWETEDWVEVRALASDAEPTETGAGDGGCGDEGAVEGTSWEFRNVVRAEEGVRAGTSWEYSDSPRTAKDEGANREKWTLGGRSKLVWRCEGESECSRNRNGRKESIAGWSCRYGDDDWDKVDRIRGTASIYSLSCNILKSHYLFSMYLNVYCFSIIYIPNFLRHVTKMCPLYHGKHILILKIRKIKK